jgi:hypothetical protein
LAKQKALDSASAWQPMPEQPRGKDSCIVQNEKIASAQIVHDVRKRRVFDLPAVSPQHEQARVAPHNGRLLRNQLIGKTKIEVEGIQWPSSCTREHIAAAEGAKAAVAIIKALQERAELAPT